MDLLEATFVGLAIILYNCPNRFRNINTVVEDVISLKYNKIEVFLIELTNLIVSLETRKLMEKAALKNIAHFNEHNIMQDWVQLLNKKQK